MALPLRQSALAGLLLLGSVDPSAAQRPRDVWQEAVRSHVPGTWDDAAASVSAWTPAQLLTMLRDVVRVKGRDIDFHETLLRGAMLHADIAMHAPDGYVRPGAQDRALAGRDGLLDVDGRYAGTTTVSPDWAFARLLLDRLPAPEAYPPVRTWYRATLTWLARDTNIASAVDHVEHALRLFPDDPDILMVRGWINETFAAPTTRALIESLGQSQSPKAVSRTFVAAPAVSVALERAEADYSAALAGRPGFTEARIHRARIVHLRGRPADAVGDLRQALAETTEPFLVHLAALFLGRALDDLGEHDAAAEAYGRASDVFPFAQSMRFGRSRMALQMGDRQAALRELRAAITLDPDHPLRGDPWWGYQLGPGRHVDAQMAALHAVIPR